MLLRCKEDLVAFTRAAAHVHGKACGTRGAPLRLATTPYGMDTLSPPPSIVADILDLSTCLWADS